MAFNCVDRACEPEVCAVSPVRHRGPVAQLPGRSSSSPLFRRPCRLGVVLVTKPIIEAVECS